MAEFFGDDVARNPAVSDTPGHPAEFQTQTKFVMSYRTLHDLSGQISMLELFLVFGFGFGFGFGYPYISYIMSRRGRGAAMFAAAGAAVCDDRPAMGGGATKRRGGE